MVLLNRVAGRYAAYVWNNVGITVWFDAATVESLAVFERGVRALIDEHPEGLSSVHIMVPGGKSLPDPEARAEIVRIMREFGPRCPTFGVVIPGDGFWASALRSMFTALAMLTSREARPRVFRTFDEVVEWLPGVHAERTGVHLEPGQLRSALREIERGGMAETA